MAKITVDVEALQSLSSSLASVAGDFDGAWRNPCQGAHEDPARRPRRFSIIRAQDFPVSPTVLSNLATKVEQVLSSVRR